MKRKKATQKYIVSNKQAKNDDIDNYGSIRCLDE